MLCYFSFVVSGREISFYKVILSFKFGGMPFVHRSVDIERRSLRQEVGHQDA